MEKSGFGPGDNSLNSINYAEGRNATPTAPPAYDEAMASAYSVHNSMAYENPYPGNAAPSHPQPTDNSVHNNTAFPYPANVVSSQTQQTVTPYPPVGSYPQQVPTVITVPGTMPGIPLPVGPRPIKTTCSSCNKHITSRTTVKNSMCCKYLLCTLLCLTIGCIPCALLPFCLCGPERTSHFCPKCNAHLGTWINH